MRRDDWKTVNKAIDDGLMREISERALPDQTLTYILSDKKFFPHANLSSAKAEKEFLQTALERDFRIYKIWNTDRESIINDMELIRSELTKLSNWGALEEAIDRLLKGAGF